MSTIALWRRQDAFADFDETFNALMRRALTPVARPNGYVPAADLDRDGDDAVVRLELPGVDVENDVTLQVTGGRLAISGERRSERSDDSTGRQYREVRYGSFHRSFALPEHVSAESITASYDAGVLTVRVAGAYRAPESTARRIEISSAPAAAVEGEQAPAVESEPAAVGGEQPVA